MQIFSFKYSKKFTKHVKIFESDDAVISKSLFNLFDLFIKRNVHNCHSIEKFTDSLFFFYSLLHCKKSCIDKKSMVSYFTRAPLGSGGGAISSRIRVRCRFGRATKLLSRIFKILKISKNSKFSTFLFLFQKFPPQNQNKKRTIC